jgi:hypothetical protein
MAKDQEFTAKYVSQLMTDAIYKEYKESIDQAIMKIIHEATKELVHDAFCDFENDEIDPAARYFRAKGFHVKIRMGGDDDARFRYLHIRWDK